MKSISSKSPMMYFIDPTKRVHGRSYDVMWNQIVEEVPGILPHRFQLEIIEFSRFYRSVENAVKKYRRSL